MKRSWGLIPKIISGEKTVESRWYQARRTPWNKIGSGDMVYFKNSGEAVNASAKVSKVLQYELKDLVDIEKILRTYGKNIFLPEPNPRKWGRQPKYCVLIFLEDAKKISKPFHIDKTGFGMHAAWISVEHIHRIRKT